jgi:carbon monoxide dehydrogenase subunit G
MECAMMSDRDENEMHAMDKFDNSFQIPLPPAEAWKVLLDIKRIAPCLPGVELTETVNERNYKGKISVPLGPVAFAFAGAGEIR